MTIPVPDWMRGLWRRRSIEYPDGRRDDTTIVYWLQTETTFADIRIPIDRPDLGAVDRLDTLSEAHLLELARQGGFAGWTELDGDICRWHRAIDYQPPSGVPDEGRLRQEGGVLIEEGVHERYVEVWEPVGTGPGSPRPVSRVDRDGSRRRVLVAWGEAFLFALDRGGSALPPAASLAALVHASAGGRDDLVHWLDCEISFGVRTSASWEIRLSTLPWRQGKELARAAPPNSSARSPGLRAG